MAQTISLKGMSEEQKNAYKREVERHMPKNYTKEMKDDFFDQLFSGLKLKSSYDFKYRDALLRLKKKHLIVDVFRSEDGVNIFSFTQQFFLS